MDKCRRLDTDIRKIFVPNAAAKHTKGTKTLVGASADIMIQEHNTTRQH